ncbi:MAG: hypothetical protein NXI11_14540 [Proteobacteria bacterium]|nr:hypothetical protein [Pseudomonadota bacterium]
MAKQLRPRLYLPVAETLHIAHVLTQAVKGLLLGRTGGQYLRGYVEGSQLDREGRSGHLVDAEPTRFDKAKGQWRLHHSEEAAESGLRAYVADLMEVLKCHQDFQFCGDDASLLRAYVAK